MQEQARGSGKWLAMALAGVVAGTALQLQQAELWAGFAYGGLALVGCALCAAWRRVRSPLVVFMAAGLLAFALAGARASAFAATALDPALEGRDVSVTGLIAAMPQRGDAGQRFRFELEAPSGLPPEMLLGWYADGATASIPQLRPGERWRMTVRLKAPHGNVNPNGFDYELWLWEQGLQATGYVRAGAKDAQVAGDWQDSSDARVVGDPRGAQAAGDVRGDSNDARAAGDAHTASQAGGPLRLGRTWRHPLEQLRWSVRESIYERVADRRLAGVIAALVVGDQSAIERNDWDVFRATGVAHLMSISGLHITMFAWLAAALVGAAWRRSERLCLACPAQHAALAGGLVLATLYALFSGWGVPSQRTIWMLATVGALRMSGKAWPWPITWLLACAVVVTIDPWAMLQAGFWLSFVAVGVLFATDRSGQSRDPRRPLRHSRESGNPADPHPRHSRESGNPGDPRPRQSREGGHPGDPHPRHSRESGNPGDPQPRHSRKSGTPGDPQPRHARESGNPGDPHPRHSRESGNPERWRPWIPAFAGMTEERGAAMTEERGAGMTEERAAGMTEERGAAMTKERGAAMTEERGAAMTEQTGAAATEKTGAGMTQRLCAATRSLLREQAIVTVALTPLSLLLFGQVSLVGIFANLLAIPWVTLVVTPLAMGGVFVGALWGMAAWSIQVLGSVLQWLAQLPLATLSVAAAPLWAGIAGVAGGLLLAMPWPRHMRLLGLPLLLPVLLWQAPRPATGEFELLAADIGQGNALIVRTAQHALVYDAGPRYSLEADAGHRVLVPLLRSLDARVDIVVLSHRDTDHVGGAAAVLTMQPDAALVSSIAPDHELQALRRATRCEAGQHWQWDGVAFDIVHPVAGDYANSPKSNAISCVLRISNGRTAALLTGDIEAPQEAALVARHSTLAADVLLVPHHGSKTSSSDVFLQAVAPKIGLVQAGYRNRFGHPAAQVVQRLREHGLAIFDSPHCGAALWRSTEPGAVRCEREAAARYWRHRAP
ncbi:MAG TPA: DNA internalization-related competence protein ComEC/Rec2 [Ramlibacter sp.]|uniref:DNA internalization-related competence protein ComEC/Rec2 n=1 Tax=Ramlibacter sp. TaxID=1917967 RepID=UPI002CBDF523|nr:DNA internalization-related competence protein ComEC/Rec2 [Ramlibacter sp.]HVZ45853.1 DNA internalization-related competence protein ComEC/Rec2 [Ramlibacter sp.]